MRGPPKGFRFEYRCTHDVCAHLQNDNGHDRNEVPLGNGNRLHVQPPAFSNPAEEVNDELLPSDRSRPPAPATRRGWLHARIRRRCHPCGGHPSRERRDARTSTPCIWAYRRIRSRWARLSKSHPADISRRPQRYFCTRASTSSLR